MREVILSKKEIMSLALFAKTMKQNDCVKITQSQQGGIGIGTTATMQGKEDISKDITDYSLW